VFIAAIMPPVIGRKIDQRLMLVLGLILVIPVAGTTMKEKRGFFLHYSIQTEMNSMTRSLRLFMVNSSR